MIKFAIPFIWFSPCPIPESVTNKSIESKKRSLVFMLLVYLTNSVSAQELSEKYFAECRSVLKSLRKDMGLRQSNPVNFYILSCQYDDCSEFPSPEGPLPLDATPWICYQFYQNLRLHKIADTVRLTTEEVKYLAKNVGSKHDAKWRSKLAAGTGLLAKEPPLVTERNPNCIMVSPPTFFQNNTVCVVYVASESLYGFGGGYYVYKKAGASWIFINDVGHFIACGGPRRK